MPLSRDKNGFLKNGLHGPTLDWMTLNLGEAAAAVTQRRSMTFLKLIGPIVTYLWEEKIAKVDSKAVVEDIYTVEVLTSGITKGDQITQHDARH